MKNKKSILLVSLAAIGACQGYMPDQPLPEIAPLTVVECDQAAQKTITIIANKAQFTVKPPHLCVDPGDTININFSGNHAAGTFTVKAKPFIDADWLEASNPGTNPDKATIDVPPDADDGTYFYDVIAIGWGTIDPMITVD